LPFNLRRKVAEIGGFAGYRLGIGHLPTIPGAPHGAALATLRCPSARPL